MLITLDDDSDRLKASTLNRLLEAQHAYWATVEEMFASGSPANTAAVEIDTTYAWLRCEVQSAIRCYDSSSTSTTNQAYRGGNTTTLTIFRHNQKKGKEE